MVIHLFWSALQVFHHACFDQIHIKAFYSLSAFKSVQTNNTSPYAGFVQQLQFDLNIHKSLQTIPAKRNICACPFLFFAAIVNIADSQELLLSRICQAVLRRTVSGYSKGKSSLFAEEGVIQSYFYITEICSYTYAITASVLQCIVYCRKIDCTLHNDIVRHLV